MSVPSLSGKTALVTGATNGIGKETALALARAGATVVIVGRNRALTEATAEEIRCATGNYQVDYLVADLSSRAETRRIAEEFLASERPLHILVNNAGALFHRFEESPEGVEMSWALNHLGYFHLTRLLQEKIIESAPARIINVSSVAHNFALNGIHFSDPQYRRGYIGFLSYAQSKLANLLFTRELAKRLRGSGVTVNAVHPGIVASQFGQRSAVFRFFSLCLAPFRRNVAKGAETVIYLAMSPAVEGVTGEYFADNQIRGISHWARNERLAQQLWEVSERSIPAA